MEPKPSSSKANHTSSDWNHCDNHDNGQSMDKTGQEEEGAEKLISGQVVVEVPYVVRRMKESEIPLVLELCKREGRQMGLSHELVSWFRFDPQGFYVAVHPDSGEILGSCSGIRLSSNHGNIGMFVVREDLRGKGIGKNIWNHVMDHLNNFNPSSPQALDSSSQAQSSHALPQNNANLNSVVSKSVLRIAPNLNCIYKNKKRRNIGLSALNPLLSMYRDRCGFVHVSDFAVHLYALDLKKLDNNGLFLSSFGSSSFGTSGSGLGTISTSLSSSGLKVVPFSPRLIYALLSFDAALHSYDRRKILKLLLSEPEVTFRVAFRGGKISGYGALKPSLQENCWMVAPLYASDSVVAKELLCELIRALFFMIIFEENNSAKSENSRENFGKIVLKIPSNNLDGITMIESIGFEKLDNYISYRCYTENYFMIQSRKIFAFHSTVFCSE